MNLGLALGFLMMRFTSIDTYLLTSFVFLLLGVLGYFIIELYDMFLVRKPTCWPILDVYQVDPNTLYSGIFEETVHEGQKDNCWEWV